MINVWFVMCRRSRLLSMDDLVALVAQIRGITVVERRERVLELVATDPKSGARAPIELAIETGPEAAEFALERADLELRDDLAVADARYEVTWENQHHSSSTTSCCF